MNAIAADINNGGNPVNCPFCGKSVHIPLSDHIIDIPCPACGVLFWYISLEDTHIVFNKDRFDSEGWAELHRNVPNRDDDSIEFVEKLLYLRSMGVSNND